jgi:anthranilate synthase/aminodeoxychorismate synthase-like glutamine amidotransferase
MILVIDNYDSFTFNLVHLLGDLGACCQIMRNDSLTVEEAIATRPDAIVLSPGPCTPNEAGICLELIKSAAGKVPILGVCLGHQAIGQAFGAIVKRANIPVHGKVSKIYHDNQHLFSGIPNPLEATRYHSLMIDRETLPNVLEATAFTDDGLVMAIRHRILPIFGLQFHPESIASQHGLNMVANFLEVSRSMTAPIRARSPF